MRVALDEADDDVQVVLLRERAEIIGGRPRHGLGHVGVAAHASLRKCLGQHDQVGLRRGGLLDERCELPAIARWSLAVFGHVVHGRQTHLAARRVRGGHE